MAKVLSRYNLESPHKTHALKKAVVAREFARVMTVVLVVGLIQAACSSTPFDIEASKLPGTRGQSPAELSLASDRSQIEQLRKDIPEEIRKENDEMALILNLLKSEEEEPNRLRERFNKVMRDRREIHDRELRRKRDEFSRSDRKAREEFIATQKSERDEFMRRGQRSAEERREFFDSQDVKRKDFFSAAADQRKVFESEQSAVRRDFEAEARERANRFTEELRVYSNRFYERKKAEALKGRIRQKESDSTVTGSAQRPTWEREFEAIPKTPPTPLGPAGSEK
jgi:hypothetical protein